MTLKSVIARPRTISFAMIGAAKRAAMIRRGSASLTRPRLAAPIRLGSAHRNPSREHSGLLDRGHRLAAIRARALICLFSSSPSAVNPPCLRAFRLRLGAPPPAPCIRQTLWPRIAGAWHGDPLLFDLAWHHNARRISKSMGLFSGFFVPPSPLGAGLSHMSKEIIPEFFVPRR